MIEDLSTFAQLKERKLAGDKFNEEDELKFK